ncbi:MAG: (Fe-S)-binding protein, partial [Bacteroidales bacterium]|nr:(Fe-S)-binding protein [Bacteroidales bacterium]
IDACQLNFSTGITNIQSAYLMKGIRNNEDVNDIAFNCLMCGRCDRYCPVGIELTPIRMIRRRAESVEPPEKSLWSRYFPDLIKIVNTRSNGHPAFSWLPQIKTEATEVLYYAGCMTHLTPAIKKAMIRILDASGMNYRFLDEAGGVCCGRPLMLAGKDKEARELINFNSGLIRDSGARILVTSCPICYKVFRESYYLEVELMHHTQFIKMLIDEDMLRLRFLRKKVVYHAPCDLGRGSGIYDEPKDVLRHVARLQPTGFDDDDSLCCGGSLGNTR